GRLFCVSAYDVVGDCVGRTVVVVHDSVGIAVEVVADEHSVVVAVHLNRVNVRPARSLREGRRLMAGAARLARLFQLYSVGAPATTEARVGDDDPPGRRRTGISRQDPPIVSTIGHVFVNPVVAGVVEQDVRSVRGTPDLPASRGRI